MLRVLAALAIAACVCAVPVSAIVTVPKDFRRLVMEAALIVRGRVTDVRATTAGPDAIQSLVTVAVAATLKGESAAFVSVMLPGGQIGRTRSVMVGAPRLAEGEDVVLFLKRGPDGVWRPVHLMAGVLRVQRDARSGRPSVASPVVAGLTASPGRVVRGDERRRQLDIAEFESLLRAVMRPEARQPRPIESVTR